MFRYNCATFVLVILFTSQASGAERRVAGRTLDQYASQLREAPSETQNEEAVRVIRLRAIRSIGAFGSDAGDVLRESLGHDDPAVRYIAAVQLGRIGGEPLEEANTRLLELAADESSLAVQLAASYALCRAGAVKEHLPILIKTLEYPERGTACSAAELIGGLGPSAAAAMTPLEAVYAKHRPGVKGGDYHIGGAAMNAIRKIRASKN